jgi:MoaA/NifB/PqqE/SkfB family radical SAM enzyme
MRALAWLAGVAGHAVGARVRPRWCTYLVTYRCNARCGMCDSWRLKPGRELAVADVRAVFKKLGRLDVVRLSGGEPFLREDFGAIAETVLATSDPLVLHVTTNGSFPDRVDALARALPRKRLQVMVSLDGLPEEHDRNRGREVSFAQALETVRRLRARAVHVSVNHTVISRQSLADAAPLRAQLAALGVDLHVVLAYADSAMYGIKLRGTRATSLIQASYPLHPALEGADVIGFIDDELRALPQIRDWPTRLAKRYYLRGLRARLAGQGERGPRCVALRSHVRLLPDGSVPVCQFNTERVGNLHEQSFDEVWTSPAATESRQWVDACKGCWAECEVLPSAIYTGDLLREVRAVVGRSGSGATGRPA